MGIFDVINLYNPFLNVFRRANIYRKILAHIGENVQIFHKVSFGSEPYLISLGNNVKITYGVKFITHDGGAYVLRNLYGNAQGMSVYGRIKIGNNVFIGNDAIIMPGVSIGNNCIIAAGSIVTKSIPDNSVAAGVPCRVIKSIEEYYNKVKSNFVNSSNLSQSEKKDYLLNLFSENPRLLIKK